jgi:hypothetical protein
LHADHENTLELGRIAPFLGRDGRGRFLASDLVHIGLAAFDNADGNLEQTQAAGSTCTPRVNDGVSKRVLNLPGSASGRTTSSPAPGLLK